MFKGLKGETPVADYRNADRITISAAGIKLLDEICAEAGIYFPEGATDWNFAKGLWRIDYNYRYKKYSFFKWEEVEEEIRRNKSAFVLYSQVLYLTYRGSIAINVSVCWFFRLLLL